MKKGGKVESKLMKKEGRGMAKATMQKVASKVVRGHEKRMHKMNSGGSIDGIALRGTNCSEETGEHWQRKRIGLR
jgi:hypothetical protein